MTALAARLRATARVGAQVLRNPALRRVALAFLAFNTVEYGSWVAILLYAYQATGAASVGVVALVQLVPAAVVAPMAATLGDRYPRRRVLTGAYALLGLLTGLTGAGMLAGWPPPAVYLCAISASLPLTLVRPTHNAILPSLAQAADELTAANAATSIAEAGGLLLGPLVAAAVLVDAEPDAVLGLLALVAGVAAALVGWPARRAGASTPGSDLGAADGRHGDAVPLERHDGRGHDDVVHDPLRGLDPAAPGPTRRNVRVTAGFRALAVDADARLIVLILAARTLMIGVTDVLFVLLALELFETGESGAAVLSAAMGMGGVIGGGAAFLLVGRRRIAPVMIGSSIVWGVTFALMGVAASGLAAPALLVIGGTGLSVLDVAGRTILQRAVRNAVLARVFGILEGLMMAALAIGSILVPPVVGVAGLGPSVLVFAALLPMLLLVAWPGLRALDRRAAVPARAIVLLRRTGLFQVLDPPAMEVVARAATWLDLPPGAVVIRQGETGDRFYVLETGSVRVSRGGLAVRTLASAGDSFGEIALLRDVPRTATVEAVEPTTLLVLGREAFLAAVTGHPVVGATADRTVEGHLRADAGIP
jgi:MFS family permease